MSAHYDYTLHHENLRIVSVGGVWKDVSDNHEPEKLAYTGGKYGILDIANREIVPLVYDHLEFDTGGLIRANINGQYMVINQQGAIISQAYEYIFPYSEGMAAVQSHEGIGFIDIYGKEVIPCRYRHHTSFSGGYASVANGQWKYGVIDKNGKEIIPCQYDRLVLFAHGMAVVCTKEMFGIIDSDGKEIAPMVYDEETIYDIKRAFISSK